MFRPERVALLLATLEMACHHAQVNARGPHRDLQGSASCSGLLLWPPLSPVSSFLRRLQLPRPPCPSRRGPTGSHLGASRPMPPASGSLCPRGSELLASSPHSYSPLEKKEDFPGHRIYNRPCPPALYPPDLHH